MFSQYCSEEFVVEQVEVNDPEGLILTPNWNSQRKVSVPIDYLSKGIGVEIDKNNTVAYLLRMQLPASLSDDGKEVVVTVPPLRSDIFHSCDILEDVAIGYGFNTILEQAVAPSTLCHGKQQPLEQFSNTLRKEVALSGWTEVLTFSLCSKEDNYDHLLRPYDNKAVLISNPINKDFQIVRTSLYPGLFKTLENSRNMALPLRLFEVSDVVFLSTETDVGAKNQRCLCALYANTSSDFERIHGLLDRVLLLNRVLQQEDFSKWQQQYKLNSEGVVYHKYYFITPHEDPLYIPNTCGQIVLVDSRTTLKEVLGTCGIIHPTVMSRFGFFNPVCAFHINVEPLL
eukprot:TRINITY_DN9720_c0_g1_i15.p1 TRINITY_DN9720_c0_g1~~TRINITY_DN9720_c0_g1_i15.p1  ORF type:complete len:393 (-),score=84.34 TRINITY_DN9720_c0_g1_i15:68-1093(-)